jgi:hypothetical protein
MMSNHALIRWTLIQALRDAGVAYPRSMALSSCLSIQDLYDRDVSATVPRTTKATPRTPVRIFIDRVATHMAPPCVGFRFPLPLSGADVAAILTHARRGC